MKQDSRPVPQTKYILCYGIALESCFKRILLTLFNIKNPCDDARLNENNMNGSKLFTQRDQS